MRAIATTVFCILTLVLDAQEEAATLRFKPCFGDHALKLNREEKLADGTSIRITRFRFYVGVPVMSGDGRPSTLPYTYHLVDGEDTASWTVAIQPSSPFFLLGVDSLTNVSGAFGGDLDPIKGMYWAWNSGYINLKLEGSSPASPYASREFELHLGGYLPPNATAQQVALPKLEKGEMIMRVDILPLLEAADVRTKCNVMSPGEAAVRLSRVATTMFRTDAGR
jgi:hypothetical protein